MLVFDATAPFPLFSEGSYSHAEARAHAAEVDAWLGLRCELVEERLRQAKKPGGAHEHWIGLGVQSLQTPYTELRLLLERLAPPPGSLLVDLGAGYGRLGLVLAAHFPEVRFIGYEAVAERIAEARTCPLPFARPGLVEADLSDPGFAPAEADYYFIYDFGSREAVEKTLGDLRTIARKRPITVVGRGRRTRDLIERGQPWLASVVPPQHFAHYSIYRVKR
jgi:hypothetical protein